MDMRDFLTQLASLLGNLFSPVLVAPEVWGIQLLLQLG
jgi:hypothetical protein